MDDLGLEVGSRSDKVTPFGRLELDVGAGVV